MRPLLLLLLSVGLSAGCQTATAAGRALAPAPAGSLRPTPLLSRGKAVHTNVDPEHAQTLTDGLYTRATWGAGHPTLEAPSWAAIDLGVGPKKLLLAWTASNSFNHHETTYGGPGSYRVEVSADSKTGADGTWKTVAEVTDNAYRTRAHAFDFTGNRWVRLVITGPSPTTYQYGVQLDELDVHDLSAGADDTWFFLGDSITAMAFNRAPDRQPSFAEAIAKAHRGYFPLQLNGGNGYETAADGLKRLPALLAEHPEIHLWCLGFGTNDAASNNADPSTFASSLAAMVKLLEDSGKVPVLARIPFALEHHSAVPKFNAVIDALAKQEGLLPGPDLYAHFKAHPDELSDGIHPTSAGSLSINRLWAAAVDGLYPHLQLAQPPSGKQQ